MQTKHRAHTRRLAMASAFGCSILLLSACTGYSNAPTGSGNASAPAGATTINVVAINGAMSFSPNPASIPAGQTVVWHNIDSVTHRVVLNDGTLDTGNLDPGTYSSPMTIGTPGGYHCSIHPVMVGTITR